MFSSRAPVMSTFFGDCLPPAVGKPAGARLRETSRERDISAFVPGRAGPPCGHPASNGSVLDGTLPASGRLATTLVPEHGVGESAAAFSADSCPAESSRLTPFASDGAERERPDTRCLSSLLPLHVNATAFSSPGCLLSSETVTSALSRFVRRASFAGRRIWRCTCSSMFENVD